MFDRECMSTNASTSAARRRVRRSRGETRTDRVRRRAVVDREQCRDEWAIRLIARERAESRRVAEEERNVPQFANGRVGYDRMRVVEVEAVVKMVRVGREERREQCSDNSQVFLDPCNITARSFWRLAPIQLRGASSALWMHR